jgi:hypothetical protein
MGQEREKFAEGVPWGISNRKSEISEWETERVQVNAINRHPEGKRPERGQAPFPT